MEQQENLRHYQLMKNLEFIKFVVEKVNKRVPVIAGTGSNNTAASIELSKKAEALGVDGYYDCDSLLQQAKSTRV